MVVEMHRMRLGKRVCVCRGVILYAQYEKGNVVVILNKFSGIDEIIEYHCKEAPEKNSFSIWQKGKWQSYTRKDFWLEVEKYSALFSSAFTQPSLILLIKTLDIKLLAAYIGVIKAGHIPAQISPFSPKVSEAEYNRKINHILDITGAKGIFTDEHNLSRIPKKNGLAIFTPETLLEKTEVIKGKSLEIALAQFSSGTTGLQKGVMLSHKAIINHMKNYSQVLNLSDSDSLVSWLPLYHDMGLIACFLMPLMCGITFYQIDPFDWILSPDLLLQTIEEKKNTICFLPNFAFQILINKGKAHNLSSLRLIINCSEPVSYKTHQQFCQKYSDIKPEILTVSYALAENTFAVSQYVNGKEYGVKKIHNKEIISCGHVITGTNVRISEPDSQGVGEIGIKGESLFSSFIDGSLPLSDGYYLTGDLGILTKENELFVTGRKKDLIIVNGKNIYPQDVESVVSDIAGVYPGRVAAFGIINENSGSEELFVIAETDGSIDNTILKLNIQKNIELEIGLQAKRVEIVEHMKLVKTSSGKISRSRNKELYEAGEFKLK
jgi:fatty-acyl-CoA synthase